MTSPDASENIHPVFDRMLGRESKERLLGQRGLVVWLYGLSGSGKSTLAVALERKLHDDRLLTQVLDGDNIRTGLNRNLGFSDEDREENIRRIAEVAKLFARAGVITINSFITPKRRYRELAREIIGPEDLFEVYVRCSFETCERRDVKGLYAKARAGKVAKFTGRDSEFEPPEQPDLVLDTEEMNLESALQLLYSRCRDRLGAPDKAGS